MRCWLVVLVLCVVPPVSAQTNFEKSVDFWQIIHSGNYERAIQYADVFQTEKIDFNRHIYFCLAYALWDKAKQALPHCQEITNRPEWPDFLECAEQASRAGDDNVTCAEKPLLTIANLKLAEALTFYRLGRYHEALESANTASSLSRRYLT